MVSIAALRKLALSFPEVREEPHFEKISFRVKQKIFATYDAQNKTACLLLGEIDQEIFASAGKAAIYPVANKWGKHGWTIVEMHKVHHDLFADALAAAYCRVAPPRLARRVSPDNNQQ